MRIVIAAVGRLKAGAERELVERYGDRAAKAGRVLGITRLDTRELTESRAQTARQRCDEEAEALLAGVPAGAVVVALDETGRALTSQQFADWIDGHRDRGTTDLVFLIGGPDGHGATVRARADLTLALGAMTYPHQIARVLLTEQVYRAVTILTGHPYHRE